MSDPRDLLPTVRAVTARNNVTVLGREDGAVLLFAHGFGCDQGMYRRILPFFVQTHRVILFDHVGSGGSDLDAYDPVEYGTLDRYVTDILEICEAFELRNVTLVAHSVGAMMAIAAAVKAPEQFAHLILVAPSPSYLDDAATGYEGGMDERDVEDLLGSLDDNHLAWAATMAPVVMGNPDSPELASELEGSFCRVDPRVVRTFARVSFTSDVRNLLPSVRIPSLILQSSNDALAPLSVGQYMHRQLAGSELVVLSASGHVPQASAPTQTATAILDYLAAVA